MNRMALGLAVGAGYVLGRTRKVKAALALGSLVAGRRLNLSPKAIGDVVSRQLRENPQFKELGEQLRQDLGGVGRAASGAMVERRLDSLADRLHDRTARVRDELAGSRPDPADTDADGEAETDEELTEGRDERGADEPDEVRDERRPAARKAPARKKSAAGSSTGSSAKSSAGAGARTAAGSGARTASAGRTRVAGKPAASRTAGARRGAEGAPARSRQPKGGGDR